MTTYTTFEKIYLTKEPGLNEKWVQDRIAENPAILGLGELILKDKERIQPKAGAWTCFCKTLTTHAALRLSCS